MQAVIDRPTAENQIKSADNESLTTDVLTPRQSPQGEEANPSGNSKVSEPQNPNHYRPPPDYPYKISVAPTHIITGNVQSSPLQHNVYNSTHMTSESTPSPIYPAGSQSNRRASSDSSNNKENEGDPPPPEYPGNRSDVRRSYEILDIPSNSGSSQGQSSSQPELSTQTYISTHNTQNGAIPKSNNHPAPCRHHYDQQDFAAVASRASKMVEILSDENKQLRSELEGYYRKVSRLQKFELELQKVQEAHDALVRSSAKREVLENAIRAKQEQDIKQLESKNLQLLEKMRSYEGLVAHKSNHEGLQSIITQQEQTISSLTKKLQSQTEEVKVLQHQVNFFQQDLANEKIISTTLHDELDAYKVDASNMIEEESEIRMAALQQSTKDSERMIKEAESEKLKFMDAAYESSKHTALLESKVKALEASCAEKDAIVRVLQRRQRSNLSGRGQVTSEPAPHQRNTSEPSASSGIMNSQSTPSISQIGQLDTGGAELSESSASINNEQVVAETWQV